MAYQKLQAGTAIAVIPADFINVPCPSDFISTETGAITLTNTLTGSVAATFDDGSLKVGDIIYHHVTPQAVRIVDIVSNTVLTVDDGNGGAVTNAISAAFEIFKDRNQACVLYVGVAGNLSVRMSNATNRDFDMLFTAAANGYHPIQVKRVRAGGTTATNILALW